METQHSPPNVELNVTSDISSTQYSSLSDETVIDFNDASETESDDIPRSEDEVAVAPATIKTVASLRCAYKKMMSKPYTESQKCAAKSICECESEYWVDLKPPLLFLALIPPKADSSTCRKRLHLLHRILINILVVWTFIGWSIKAGFALGGYDMPLIPGWFEVSVSERTSIPSGMTLSCLSGISFIFIQWYFSQHRYYLLNLSERVCPTARDDVGRAIKRYMKMAWIYGSLAAVLARATNVAIAFTACPNNYHISQPPLLVFFDTLWTLVAFFTSFFANVYVASYLSLICELHILYAQAYGLFALTKPHERCVKDLVAKHIEICQSVERTARIVQPYAVLMSGVVGLAFFTTVIDALILKPHLSVGLRIFYIVWVCLPALYALFKAARMSGEMNNLVTVVNRLPPRPNLNEAAFLNTYFSASKSDGKFGINLCGVVLQLRHLVRLGYVLGVFTLTMIQYRLSINHR